LARRVAVNSACRFNRVQLVAGSRTVNTIRLYIETLSEHYDLRVVTPCTCAFLLLFLHHV